MKKSIESRKARVVVMRSKVDWVRWETNVPRFFLKVGTTTKTMP